MEVLCLRPKTSYRIRENLTDMNPKTLKKAIIFIVLLGLVALFFSSSRTRGFFSKNPEIFSKQNMVESLWYRYKQTYFEPETGRALDKNRNNITTSEGQSYALLQAVWMNDKETFDRELKWTEDNLRRENDYLHSWLFGQRSDGSYGIIEEEGGQNTATDADTDIAVALLFASYRFNDQVYKEKAKFIIRDIWDKEVVTINNKNYLVANDIEKNDLSKDNFILNPSYFAPYAYRMFGDVDKDHDWESVIDSSYEVLNQNLTLTLDKDSTAGIPSDWIYINKNTGLIQAVPTNTNLSTAYSYDALRIPFRIALDHLWYGDPRALEFLNKLTFFKKVWDKENRVGVSYSHSGEVLDRTESPAMYGGLIGYYMFTDPKLAKQIYLTKIESLYNPDSFDWKEPQSYYDANWAWFGIALYNNLLPNLYKPNNT